MKIKMVVPSWHYFANPFKLQPLYELYFATVLKDALKDRAFEIGIIDRRQLRLNEHLEMDLDADLYLYWIMKAADYNEILDFMSEIRTSRPDAKHIAGGTHVEGFAEECAQHFDAVIVGPGERSFPRAVLDFETGNLQKTYQDDWCAVNYSDYPYPSREFLEEDAIVNTELFEKYGKERGTSVMFSRGCDFSCAYCVYNVPHRIQRRENSQIVAEIEYLKKHYGLIGINLRDEICIPLNEKIALPYLDALGGCNIIWRGQTKVGATKESIRLAAESGCKELSVGVESVDQRVLDLCRKGQKVEQAREFIFACKEQGIKIKMCLIMGLPGERKDILQQTIQFLEEVQPDFVNVSGFDPVPGCAIYQQYQDYGIKCIDTNWSKHAHLMLRYQDHEDFGLPFEYETTGRWSENLSREQIYHNILSLQQFCRENDMLY